MNRKALIIKRLCALRSQESIVRLPFPPSALLQSNSSSRRDRARPKRTTHAHHAHPRVALANSTWNHYLQGLPTQNPEAPFFFNYTILMMKSQHRHSEIIGRLQEGGGPLVFLQEGVAAFSSRLSGIKTQQHLHLSALSLSNGLRGFCSKLSILLPLPQPSMFSSAAGGTS